VSIALSSLASALEGVERRGADVEVVDATHDSRQVAPGWLFCAVPGTTQDGHEHAGRAVEQGAAALLVERWLPIDVPQLRVPSVRGAMGTCAALVHGRPSEHLTAIGITGTNGKTTTAYLVEAAAAACGVGTGVIGTVETRIHGETQPGVRTTPEGTDLQRLLRRMYDRGVDAVAMEVSSHGLDMRRIDGTRLAVGVFTNLSQDHLDWHGSMEAYYTAKARLFTPELAARGVVCVDDEWGLRLLDEARIPVVSVACEDPDADADHVVVSRTVGLDGGRAVVRGPDGEREVATRLVGDFNLTNAVLAEVAAVEAGLDPLAARLGIAGCPGVPGRLQPVPGEDGPTVLVDYAHSSDAIEHLVRTVRDLLDDGQRLHIVIGCGGDRDRGKRPLMGAAAMAADVAVLTSDNPRSESPEDILDAMVAGARRAAEEGARAELHVEIDRRRAIEQAIDGARPRDVVLLAGKGHETGQEIAGEILPFDDRVVAAEVLTATRRRT
jgi:UDP-N-acetylmuramoyl-L-alanyl-D-glutamate--2,6-diaminopimelate ligase